jgi:hypothetical protein
VVSSCGNHWRGLADHHTVAFNDVISHAEKADRLTRAGRCRSVDHAFVLHGGG